MPPNPITGKVTINSCRLLSGQAVVMSAHGPGEMIRTGTALQNAGFPAWISGLNRVLLFVRAGKCVPPTGNRIASLADARFQHTHWLSHTGWQQLMSEAAGDCRQSACPQETLPVTGPAEAVIQGQPQSLVRKRPRNQLIQTGRIEAAQCCKKTGGGGSQISVC